MSCDEALQGISSQWADIYTNDLPGQSFDVSGVAPGEYYLMTTVDPAGKFLETDLTNNTAWVKIYLHPKRRILKVLESSP